MPLSLATGTATGSRQPRQGQGQLELTELWSGRVDGRSTPQSQERSGQEDVQTRLRTPVSRTHNRRPGRHL